jgi:hypothetical protein
MTPRAADYTADAAAHVRVRRLVASVLASRDPEATDALIMLLELFADEQGDDRQKIEFAETGIEEAFSFTGRFAHDLKGYRDLLKLAVSANRF